MHMLNEVIRISLPISSNKINTNIYSYQQNILIHKNFIISVHVVVVLTINLHAMNFDHLYSIQFFFFFFYK